MSVRAAGAALLAPLRPALTWGERMLPGVLVIGTKRGGTSSLYDWICRHPQVAPCRTRKGTHYFDVHHGRGYAWFRSGFARPEPRWRLTGEASPYYVFHPHGPDRVRAAVPNARLILMLRDPVVRAFSQYQQEYARGFEDAETFERALELEPGRLAGERERMLADPGYDSRAMQHYAYVARGEYAPQLEAWRARFDAGQLHVILAEEFFAEPAVVYGRVLEFLGLDMPARPPLFKVHNARPAGGMAPETQARLAEQFARPNRRLEELLGRRLGWTGPDGASDG